MLLVLVESKKKTKKKQLDKIAEAYRRFSPNNHIFTSTRYVYRFCHLSIELLVTLFTIYSTTCLITPIDCFMCRHNYPPCNTYNSILFIQYLVFCTSEVGH